MGPIPSGDDTTRTAATQGSYSPLASDAPDFFPGDLVAERFRILRKLGEGGMAVVYEAVDEKLDERRALKFAKTGHASSISPEARSALRVTHENICRTYEIHTAELGAQLDFISMEFIEGETLQTRCKRGPCLHSEALEIARQLCRGLEAAHRAQILHRDLKGNNVMLARRPDGSLRVVITDFGLAKFVSEGAPPSTSAIAGTPNYLAPERWANSPATPASDVYALGVVLYESLTGVLPFSSSVPVKDRLTARPDAPSSRGEIDPRWDPIVLGCLEPDPNKRIASPEEVLRLIDKTFEAPHHGRWLAVLAALFLAAGSGYYFRDSLLPAPETVRLAILPFAAAEAAPNDEWGAAVRGGLSDVAARLASLKAGSPRLVVISPEEVRNYNVDSPELAARRLGATHALSGNIDVQRDVTILHAAVTNLNDGSVVRRFDGEFRTHDLAALSMSLAGVVTSAFRLEAAPPSGVSPQAYSEYAQGIAFLRANQPSSDGAISHFMAAQAVDPQSPLVPAGLAEAYTRKFRVTKDSSWLQQASAAAKRAQSLQPDAAPVLLALSSIQQAEGKPELAVEFLQRAVELEPDNSDVWRQMGAALDSAGRTEEAIAALQKSIQLAPGYFRPHRDLGTFYARKGQFREAIKEYEVVTQLAPELAEGYSDLGGVLLAAGREMEAESALRKSLTLLETRAALNNLGVLLRFQRRDAEAAPIMLRGIKAGSDDATIRLNLANALRRLGKATESREHYQRANELSRAALLLNPRDAASRARLAYSMVQLGSPEFAADEAMQAVRLASSDYYTLFWSIMTLDALGRQAEAYPLLAAATPQQLKDLRRQPDLTAFTKDPRFPRDNPNP